MGCSSLGNLYAVVDEARARETVVAALAAGIGYFDVAPLYGFGLAERRLGEGLAEAGTGRPVIISTKVGRRLVPAATSMGERHGFVNAAPYEPIFDYSADAILRSHEESLRRLRRDRIDILLAHDLGRQTHGDAADPYLRIFLDSGYPALNRLREEGAVSAIGIGVNEIAICETMLDQVPLDIILLAGRHTLLEQDRAKALLDRCLAEGVKVVIGGPYNSGILVQGSAAPRPRFDYEVPMASVLDRVRTLERVANRHSVSLAAAALQFPLRHPAVSTVLPGLIGQDQVRQTVRWFAEDIAADFWDDSAAAAASIETT
jgi:D-threo-aldose 1-dehydrogenase